VKKTLQIVVGILLILLLSYIAFLDVSKKIARDIFSKTEMVKEKPTPPVEVIEKKPTPPVEVVEEKPTPPVEVVEKKPTPPVEVVEKKPTPPVEVVEEKPTPPVEVVEEEAIKSIKIPTVSKVPVVIENIVHVPIPVQAITAPKAIQTKELNDEGVK